MLETLLLGGLGGLLGGVAGALATVALFSAQLQADLWLVFGWTDGAAAGGNFVFAGAGYFVAGGRGPGGLRGQD